MSRSRKKIPIVGYTTAESEKQDKRKANRKLRSKAKRLIDGSVEPDEIAQSNFDIESVSDVWVFDKDGKHYDDKPESYRK
jgi:hypothetical protein